MAEFLVQLVRWSKDIFIGVVVAVLRYPEAVACDLLFGGQIRPEHKTPFALKELVERYKKSISALNRAIYLSIGFAALALYGYFLLPENGLIRVPLVGLSVSRDIWMRLAPAIAFAIQLFTFTAFVWFMLLRLAQMRMVAEAGKTDDFGDVRNVVLCGTLSHVWIVFRIGRYLHSRWNYVWYVPAAVLLSGIILSPIFVSLFFIVHLFRAQDYWVAIPYAVLFVPYSLLFLLVFGTASILGFGESSSALANRLEEQTDGAEHAKAGDPDGTTVGRPRGSI
jgi:hypothetical protein